MTTKITRRDALKGLAVSAAALTTMRVLPASAQSVGGTLNVGLTYEIDTMNPYSTGFLGDAQATVLEGLLAPDENASYVPVLAKEVPTLENGGITLNEDGSKMTITYHLRDDVKWHDGEPFTSADVKFTWEAVKNPDFIAESKSGTEDIESIETPDDYTVICHYNGLAPDFASTLFTFGILPKHHLEGVDLNTSDFNETPLGTGPFKVTDYQAGQYVVVERNELYWGRAENGDQLPYIERIVFKMITDSNTLMTQLRSGELNLVVQTPLAQASQVRDMNGLELINAPLLAWHHLTFNFASKASLQDVTVRRAIAHAMNRDPLIRTLGGFPSPIKSPVVPVFDFYDDTVPEYAFDVEAANKMLDDAGYARGGDGIREKDGERLSYNFMVQAGRADDENLQQVMMAQLQAIGIEAVPDNKTGVALREARYNGDYDLYYGRWITSADPDYSIFWGTDGAINGQGYSNPELDAVFTELQNTLDKTKRYELFSKMQHIIVDDLPSLPLLLLTAAIAKTTELNNFVPNPTNMTNFVHTGEWYLKS